MSPPADNLVRVVHHPPERAVNPDDLDAYETDLEFSLSHNLLRGAGRRATTHAIRIADYNRQISETQTTLAVINELIAEHRVYAPAAGLVLVRPPDDLAGAFFVVFLVVFFVAALAVFLAVFFAPAAFLVVFLLVFLAMDSLCWRQSTAP